MVIGTDADYFLEPMTPLLGQRLFMRPARLHIADSEKGQSDLD